MMTTLLILGVLAVISVFLLLHFLAKRRQSAAWNDLHARGRLFTAQLAALRKAMAKNGGAGGGTPRWLRGGEMPGELQLRRPSLKEAAPSATGADTEDVV